MFFDGTDIRKVVCKTSEGGCCLANVGVSGLYGIWLDFMAYQPL